MKKARLMMLHAGLPEDAVSDCARVTMTGRSAALVEGQHGMVELSEARIRLKTGRGILTVEGNGLRLRELSVDAALIDGDVVTVTYGAMKAGREHNGP